MVVGRWKLVASENFDAILSAAGVPYMMRMMAQSAKPTVVIEVNGNVWRITIIAIKSQVMTFELNRPFVHKTMDGRTVNTTMSWFNNELVQVDRDLNGNTVAVTKRSVNDHGQLITTFQVGNITARRIFAHQG